jgi:hypothetical protein
MFRDFASGYGRFTRFLVKELPRERVWVSDIYANAVEDDIKKKAVCHLLATFKAKASRLFRTRQRPPESFNSAWGTFQVAGMRLRSKYELATVQVIHTYEVRPRKDHRRVDLISDANSRLFSLVGRSGRPR